VSIFNDVYVLSDTSFKSGFSQIFEKWDKFAELSDFGELLLEVLPDGVRLHVS